ncbi:hypothetical protein QTO34_016304 [Cnephaeus nilssonii]|uniref:Uncharacterized protein n=1 Tax=Cnephaeus nilssonii TaxID=3371016 RepID=A0AA40I5U9_CNENI|nr:hypothetical protein QTO34_016304 [Eptesicus nilssonii]
MGPLQVLVTLPYLDLRRPPLTPNKRRNWQNRSKPSKDQMVGSIPREPPISLFEMHCQCADPVHPFQPGDSDSPQPERDATLILSTPTAVEVDGTQIWLHHSQLLHQETAWILATSGLIREIPSLGSTQARRRLDTCRRGTGLQLLEGRGADLSACCYLLCEGSFLNAGPAHTCCRCLARVPIARHHQRLLALIALRASPPPPAPEGQSSVGASGASTVSMWEWRWEWGCWQTEDRGPRLEGPDGGVEDGPRPAPVPTTASQPTVPFKVHEFVHWALVYI